MSNFFDYFKKYKKVVTYIIIGIIFIPVIVNEAYKYNGGYSTLWGAEDVLAYYGSILSFLGTVFLGYVAIKQNERLIRLEEKRHRLEMQPFLTVTDWKARMFDSHDVESGDEIVTFKVDTDAYKEVLCGGVLLYLTNTSNSFTMASYQSAKVYKGDKFLYEWSSSSTNQENNKVILNVGETKEVRFCMSLDRVGELQGKTVHMVFTLENKINEKYQLRFKVVFGYVQPNGSEWFVVMSPQEYKIGKFVRDKGGKVVLEDIEVV